MLETPLGTVRLFADGDLRGNVTVTACPPDPMTRELEGRYLLEYMLSPRTVPVTLRCVLDPGGPPGEPQSGQGLEALVFDHDGVNLAIGFGHEFDDPVVDGAGSRYLDEGIQVRLPPGDFTRRVCFGVAWLRGGAEETGWQAWYGVLAARPVVRA